jgi:hypothetical protein
MKRALLKLISVFQIVAGLAGISAVGISVVGMATAEVAPMLWYGVFPLLSVIAGVLLWRGSKFAFGLSVLVQLLQVPILLTESLSFNLGAIIKLSISGIWCLGDCRVRLVLGINLLALAVLLLLLLCKSEAELKVNEVKTITTS